MRTSSLKNSVVVGLSIVLGASILSVGVSNAAGTNITACAKKSNGSMRLVTNGKPCKKSERTITWGSQGDSGATGPTGASGVNGTNGLSESFNYQFDNGSALTFTNLMDTRRVTLSPLPAGKYTLGISAMLAYSSATDHTGAAYLNCVLSTHENYSDAVADRPSIYWPKQLTGSGTARPYQISFQPSKAAFEQISNLAASSTVSIDGSEHLSFTCGMDAGRRLSEPGDETMYMLFASLVFTRVNTNTEIGNG